MRVLGIDVGGSGVKGAVVDTKTGRFITERYRVETPVPSTPRALGKAVAEIVSHFEWKGPVGCGMPGPFVHGKMMTATNLHKSCIGVDFSRVYSKASGCRVAVLNDADAAGIAEMKFGAGRHCTGVVMIVTLGTGIGSALFTGSALVPNTELGDIKINGKSAESRASARVRKEKNLSWSKWGKRLDEYFRRLEALFWPDLFIVGGGVSKKADKFISRIKTRAKIVPAKLLNDAGIVGAALYAEQLEDR